MKRRTRLIGVTGLCGALVLAASAAAIVRDSSTWGGPTYLNLTRDPPGAWLILDDGSTDQLSVKATQIALGTKAAWSVRTATGGGPNSWFVYSGGDAASYGCELEYFDGQVFSFIPYFGVIKCALAVPLHLRLGTGNDTFVVDSGLSTSFEVFGDSGNDYLRGSNGKDTLRGGAGTDTLRGGSGADSLFGLADDDLVDGGEGSDVISCGVGVDLVQYQGRSSPLNISLDGVMNDGASGENDKIINDCENVESGGGSDTIAGSIYANKLLGRDGNDTLKGGSGGDRLYGGNGGDKLFGEIGDDNLYGESGNDIIDGGVGLDTIFGGAGDDTINAKDGYRDTVNCGEGSYDVVIYDPGLDQIDASCEQR